MFTLRGIGENAVLTSNWGGLLLTLILAVFGIVVSFPLGGVFSTLPTKQVTRCPMGLNNLY